MIPELKRSLLLVLAAGCVSGCSAKATAGDTGDESAGKVEGQRLILPPNSPQLASIVSAVVTEGAPDSVRLPGRLAWNEDATVRVFSPFAGRVVKVLTDAGRMVRPDEPLALIASPDFGQAQADAGRATTDLGLAQRTDTRTRDLFQHGVVAQKDVEAADADLARARVEQERTHARLALYGVDSGAGNELFPLRSPLGGTVVERNVTPGQEVRSDQMLANAPQLYAPLFVVTDPSRLWVVLDLPENDLSLVQAGSSIHVHAGAFPDRVFRGTIVLIASGVDPSSRTVKVRGTVPNENGQLKAEMLVSVTVPAAARGGLTVPASSVLLEGQAHVVFVDEGNGRFRRAEVEAGGEHDGVVPIQRGVSKGERVVTGSVLLLEQLFQSKAHT